MDINNTPDKENNFDIAIIGMSARFPGANSIDKFWRNLRDGVESIARFSDEKLIAQGIPPALLNDPNYVKAGSFLEDAEMFDASFFGINPNEAKLTDPQQRIFLETSWEALEDAGYDPESYAGLIGVYAGSSMNDYVANLYSHGEYINPVDWYQRMIGNDKDYLTTRVSYKLNLKGPSFTVQTACSTSLVAVHLACQSLLNYQCDMALSGGVCVNLPRRVGYLYQEGMILSSDGHCRAFDEKASGTVVGEGAGIVVLKRLSEALEDGDTIHAVLKGSAINNDGSLKVGFTAPSINGQADVIASAHAFSQVNPETISYIETHGTGTKLGDPIEIAALTQAFRSSTENKRFCAIGSVKTNIGHLDAAAGVAGLIKTVLSLKHKEIPPSLHFEKTNPEIDFDSSPFYVNSDLTEWKSNGNPRRAGVSSFGIGGTNAHVILEEAVNNNASSSLRSRQLLVLSGKTETALDAMTSNLIDCLHDNPDINLADAAYTLQVGRKQFDHRRIVVCKDINDAATVMESGDPTGMMTINSVSKNPPIAFMFSGQGSQYVNMGLELYKTESRFKEQIDLCSEILKPHLSLNITDLLYPEKSNIEEAGEKLKQTAYTQPALFVIEYALAKLWMQWGVRPHSFIGHSIGEYVAACLSGVFSLEDVLSLVAVRGRLMQEMPGGSMIAVALSENEIMPLLNDELSLAAINGPSMCTVSGEDKAIEELTGDLSDRDISYRHLHTSHAFHSEMMEPVLESYIQKLNQITLSPPQIPFISNVTGSWITKDEATSPEYWGRHLRHTVRFSDGIKELLNNHSILLEVGPGQVLGTLARQQIKPNSDQAALYSVRHPKKNVSDLEFILNNLGRLWLYGVEINWQVFHKEEHRFRIPLPTYPFERKRFWIDGGNKLHAATKTKPNMYEESEHIPDSFKSNDTQQQNNGNHNVSMNEVEQKVANIWKDVLGVESVSINDDYFDLGGTSLLAVSLVSKIEKSFGKKLPIATLYEASTIGGLAKLLSKEQPADIWSPLVKIKSGGAKPPLFLLHAAYGNVLNYRDLASHLDSNQTVYGIQAKGLDGKEPVLTSIEDMAAYYVKEIQTIQPEGPYLLAGYCLGGTIALEMAQQFHAQGQKVGLLAMLETYNWTNLPNMTILINTRHFLQKIKFHWLNFLLIDSKGKKLFFREKWSELKRRSKLWHGSIVSRISHKTQNNNEQHLILARLWDINDRAAFSYVPQYYQGRVSLFLPAAKYTIHDTPEMMWNKLADDVEVFELPVYPAGSLVEPFVRILAEKLEGCIHKALEIEKGDKNMGVNKFEKNNK